ncbi:FAS1-like dehydratase domain-containing protein [Bacillus rubiinfantis]|uniref:FAS1-like dehydratase domain-containing protein n=1 Tax=Bacillus rubiinfantis TaxID=1499680 RepID=UPI000694F521|nr:MaoC family dehydratase N-terminal domain-containing protein [Bacillus rubiinfantis]
MALMKEKIQEFIGIDSEKIVGPDKVCKQMIRHWCEVMEDSNPLYQDEEYARNSKYGGIIAPPMQVQVYTMSPLWPPTDREPNPMEQLIAELAKQGYSSIVATEQGQEYFAPMMLGDEISYTISVDKVSPEKQTVRGPGYFVTFLYKFFNQRDELVCKQTFTILAYNAISKE